MHIMFSIAVQFPLKLKRQQTNQYVEWSDFFGCFFTVYRHPLAMLSTC